MKNLGYIIGGLLILTSAGAMAQDLEPDQNPNYQRSADKYAQQSDALNSNQSETVQDTYEAYDWREAKAEDKRERAARRYELQKLRAQNRYRCGNRRYYNGYNGYYNNSYYNSNSCNSLYYGPSLYYLLH